MKQFHLSSREEAGLNKKLKVITVCSYNYEEDSCHRIERLLSFTIFCLAFQGIGEDILYQIRNFYQEIVKGNNDDMPYALILDGKALEIALISESKQEFLQLAVLCDSVICCRVSPKQKALVG